MKQMHIVLVCHTEPLWWEEDWTDFRRGISLMDSLLEEVGQGAGKEFRATFCPGWYHEREYFAVLPQQLDLFRMLADKGHEIGVHTHIEYDDVVMDRDAQDRFICEDAKAVRELGFQCNTWAAGDWFVTQGGTVPAMVEAGLSVDCSVAPLIGDVRHQKTGAVIARHTLACGLKPYQASVEDIYSPGNSGVVELPVSGYLGEFSYVAEDRLELAQERVDARFYERLAALAEGEVDVFQIAWHVFDLFTEVQGKYVINERLVSNFRLFLKEAVGRGAVVSTARDAAELWFNKI